MLVKIKCPACQTEGTLSLVEQLIENKKDKAGVIAASRGATYVVENGRAKTVAQSMDVRCISYINFFEEVQPRMF
jgi:hypothetical protein